MKIQKRNGSWWFRKTIDGHTYSFTVTQKAKPTQKQIEELIAEKKNSLVDLKSAPKKTFMQCGQEYINIKENILSASTIRSYSAMLRSMPEDFLCKNLNQIDQLTIQKLINDMSAVKSAKTVKNYHSFITAVIKTFMPDAVIRTTLPKPVKKESFIPTAAEIQAVLEECKIEKYTICFLLGMHGLRRSEILALTLDDVYDDHIRVNKAKVYTDNKEWIIQNYTKTMESTRDVPIDKPLADRIRAQGYVFEGHPRKIIEYLQSCQKRAGVPKFTFHALRHFFATELDQAGFSSKDIQKLGGWSSDSIMKTVYQHNRVERDKQMQRKAANTISNILNKN